MAALGTDGHGSAAQHDLRRPGFCGVHPRRTRVARWHTHTPTVILPDGTDAEPGDEIIVHGSEIRVPYGEVWRVDREATIVRATMIERLWTRLTGDFEVMELCEFSFSERVTA